MGRGRAFLAQRSPSNRCQLECCSISSVPLDLLNKALKYIDCHILITMGNDILLGLLNGAEGSHCLETGKTPSCGGQGFLASQLPPLTCYGFPVSYKIPPGRTPLAHQVPAQFQPACATHCPLNGCQNQALQGDTRPSLQDQSKRLNPGKPRAWLAFRKFQAVCSSCGSSSTTNSLTEWQQLYWQANSIKAPASNKVSGSPLCIKNMDSCLHFPECPQP